LFYINDQIPFFNMGRQMNCYIQAPLAEGSFGWYGEAENNVVALGNDAVGEIVGGGALCDDPSRTAELRRYVPGYRRRGSEGRRRMAEGI